MDAKRIRIALIERGERLVDLHRRTGITYNRLIRVTNNYLDARPDEIDAIAKALGLSPAAIHDGDGRSAP